jgi:hypothetical protein
MNTPRPRGKNKHQEPYVMKDIYKDYIKDKEEDSPYYVSYLEFVDIVTMYYKAQMERIFKGGMFIMPYSLGTLSILKKIPKQFKSKHLQIDWQATNKLGKVVHHTNDHSDYYKFTFRWSKINTRCLNKGCYSLVMTRRNKRHLATLIKGGNTDYFEQD